MTKEKSIEYLEGLQARLDAQGRDLAFSDLFLKTKPPSISHVIGKALNMRDTHSIGKKRNYPQMLGNTRSIQDLYLLVKHYFPEASIFDVTNNLQKRLDNKTLRAHWCSTFNRMMFGKTETSLYTYNQPDLSRYGIE